MRKPAILLSIGTVLLIGAAAGFVIVPEHKAEVLGGSQSGRLLARWPCGGLVSNDLRRAADRDVGVSDRRSDRGRIGTHQLRAAMKESQSRPRVACADRPDTTRRGGYRPGVTGAEGNENGAVVAPFSFGRPGRSAVASVDGEAQPDADKCCRHSSLGAYLPRPAREQRDRRD